jgi:hypothetical protein
MGTYVKGILIMGFAEDVAQGRTKYYPRGHYGGAHRQAFHNSRTTLGAAGHFLHLATVGAPLIIGELTKDSDKRWRYTKLATFGVAAASELVWAVKVAQDRHRENQLRNELQDCVER